MSMTVSIVLSNILLMAKIHFIAIKVSLLASPPQILTSEGSVITLVGARWGKISKRISLAIRADKLFSNAVEGNKYVCH